MDFLCLFRSSDFACPYGPDGLIRNDDLRPVFRLFCDGFELRGDYFDCFVAFSLLMTL